MSSFRLFVFLLVLVVAVLAASGSMGGRGKGGGMSRGKGMSRGGCGRKISNEVETTSVDDDDDHDDDDDDDDAHSATTASEIPLSLIFNHSVLLLLCQTLLLALLLPTVLGMVTEVNQ